MPDAARSVPESRASSAGNQMRGGNTMARVPYPKLEDLPEAERPIYQRMVRERGTGHIWLALANAPKILDAMMTMAGALRNDTIFERRFRELGIVMVGLVTRSAYEFDHHWNAALAAGVLREQLENLAQFETSPHFDDKERAVLRYAKEATETGEVRDASWDALRRHFDTQQAMEVVLTVAWYNCVVRILLPLRIEHEPDFKRN
jgi:alkylhydroperoxidase family enzyme